MNSSYTLYKYLNSFGVIIIAVLLSYFHSWGYVNIYILSYFKLSDPTITMLHINFIFTVAYFSESFYWYLADWIKQKQNYSGAQCLSMVLMSAKFFVNSVSTSYLTWIFLNLIVAIGYCSYDYNSTKLLLEWFPNQAGIAGGINSAGFSFGSYYSFLAYQTINPQNMPATIPIVEGYRETKIFDESIAKNVPAFYRITSAICLVYAIVLLFIITNDPSKYHEETAKAQILDQEAIELDPKQENNQAQLPTENLQGSDIRNVNQSMLNEIDGFDAEISRIQGSLKFWLYIIIMSYMLGMPLFFNISKKVVGINAQDDLSVTWLSIPTTFLILFGRLSGAVIAEKVGFNNFVVFWLGVSSVAITLYYFFYSNPIVFFGVNSVLMQHLGMIYSSKMVYVITIYGDVYGKKLIVRAMTIMSVFRSFLPLFFDYLMTAIGQDFTYIGLVIINILLIIVIKKLQ